MYIDILVWVQNPICIQIYAVNVSCGEAALFYTILNVQRTSCFFRCGPHLATCGHAMHAACYQKFFDSLVQKERHNAINMMGKILNFDVSVGEFTCPICERLSNTVLPLIPSVSQLRAKQVLGHVCT